MTSQKESSHSSPLDRSVRGSAYNLGASVITLGLGFVRSLLLMHFLSPDDFGVVRLAGFLITFLTPLSTFGVDHALIQWPHPKQNTYATHFVIRLLLSLLFIVLGLVATPILRLVYAGQPDVTNIFLILLLINLLRAGYSTPGVILRREMRFGVIALLNVISSIVMTITAPLLAYLGAGFWSLVVEQLIGPLVRFVALWGVLHTWPLSLHIDLSEARAMINFGRHIFTSHTLGILLDRFDDFWVGTALGPTPLGFYSQAYDIAQYPERVLATPIVNVFFSTYAAVQEDRKALSQAFFRSSSFLIRAGFLMVAILFIATPEFTLLLFGKKWLPIVPLFRLMLLYVALNPLYANLSHLITGIGKPRWLVRARIVQVSVFIISVVVLAEVAGIKGVAVAADLMILSGIVVLLLRSRYSVDFSFRRLMIAPVTAVIMALGISYSLSTILAFKETCMQLLLKLTTTATIYSSILYIWERETLNEYKHLILQLARRRMPDSLFGITHRRR